MDSSQQTLPRSLGIWKGIVSMDQGLSKPLSASDDEVLRSCCCLCVAHCKMLLMTGQLLAQDQSCTTRLAVYDSMRCQYTI